ncbi:MAG TPA: (d)CMP kinase [Candidatus Lachnoclostridium stercoripullorum]|uniref:Cytidylate kinase n=1 Tax=Candidatus Lachnoclostridium stercoripullorum TaxID=2838635 RepID=A0A9D1W3X3_9FIRM|nr:(d)CMP kinase [Candidatus Lachnoclostridium stercoripullorum]
MKKTYNIAIDGPAGAGKSTIARLAAGQLGFIYVDTGAMYRAMALYFLRRGANLADEEAVGAACRDIHVEIRYEAGEQQVLLNGENVTGQIRTDQVGNAASAISKYPAVRAALLELQRSLARTNSVIMDGRDIGTLVLPDADLKIYLTASTAVRAMRRYKEFLEKGVDCTLESVEQDVIRRDEQDMNRATAPLKQAEDAVYLDASDMNISQVVEKILSLARERGLEA